VQKERRHKLRALTTYSIEWQQKISLTSRKSHPGTGSLQITKPSEPKEKHPQTHHNQNTQHTEQRKNSETAKEKRQVTYKGKPIQITADFSRS
jgi:hypothetical protein